MTEKNGLHDYERGWHNVDLVERLRDIRWPSGIMEDTAREAADAIERLAEEADYASRKQAEYWGQLAAKDAEIAALHDEIAHLKALLVERIITPASLKEAINAKLQSQREET